METPIFIVDAFTDVVFKGNPAAVVLLPSASSPLPTSSSATSSKAKNDSSTITVDDAAMQSCAEELHLSETVFLTLIDKSSDDLTALPPLPDSSVSSRKDYSDVLFCQIRWFTPTREVGLCGHATLAAAHALFSLEGSCCPIAEGGDGGVSSAAVSDCLIPSSCHRRHDEAYLKKYWNAVACAQPSSISRIALYNRFSGWLAVRRAVGKTNRYVLDFPLRTPQPLHLVSSISTSASLPTLELLLSDLLHSFGLVSQDAEELQLHHGSAKYLLVLSTEDAVRRARCDMELLRQVFVQFQTVLPVAPLSVTLTARAALAVVGGPHVVSRHFAPWVGIDEDPVTGAAHVVLVPYWLRRFHAEGALRNNGIACAAEGEVKLEDGVPLDVTLTCFQASHRGGWLYCTPRSGARIDIEGTAAIFLAGSAKVPITYSSE